MTCKIKTWTKECWSKLGTAKKLFLLGGTILLSAGLVSQLFAFDKGANDTASKNLSVGGVQNRVQYLNTLIISGGTNGVRFQYDKDSKSVQAIGSLNMQNLVVGKGNSSSPSSVVFGGTNNANNGENSFIAWGEGVRVDSSAQNVAVISSQRANVNASNTIVMHGNNINTSQGSNIMVLNAEDKTINGNYVTVLGNSSASADRTFVLGDNIVNEKSNTFVFNGNDGAFVPDQDSAFYANSKVAINADNAKAQLDVNGGAMIGIREDRSVPNWNYKGTIARFARGHEIGLCALDGKNNQRIPLSESARKFWLCTETKFVELPRNAVTNDPNRNLPGVWNQQIGRWQKGLWVYGSKNKKGHFLCADGFVPDNSDPIGKTGVECIPCEWAKSGDLNCGETKKVEETTPSCPHDATRFNQSTKKCEKVTTCMVFPGKEGRYSPDKTIEEFVGNKWVIKQKCQLTCDSGYEKKIDPTLHNEYCAKLETTCLDPSKLSFHNIDDNKIQQTSERSYTIVLGTGGISYWHVKYNWTGEGLSLSLVDNSWAPSALEVPYWSFLNTFNLFENTDHIAHLFKIKVKKQGCNEEILINIHQEPKPDLCPVSKGSLGVGIDFDTHRYNGIYGPRLQATSNGDGTIVGTDLFTRDANTHKWMLSRLNINNGFLQDHTNGMHHSGKFNLFIGSNNKLWRIHALTNTDVKECGFGGISEVHRYKKTRNWREIESGTIGLSITNDGDVYLIGSWVAGYPSNYWSNPSMLGDYTYLD